MRVWSVNVDKPQLAKSYINTQISILAQDLRIVGTKPRPRPRQHLAGKVWSWRCVARILVSKILIFHRQSCPGWEKFWFLPLLILAHFGKEFVHFGENLYIWARRDDPTKKIFNIFLTNPALARNKHLTFIARTLPNHLGLRETEKVTKNQMRWKYF